MLFPRDFSHIAGIPQHFPHPAATPQRYFPCCGNSAKNSSFVPWFYPTPIQRWWWRTWRWVATRRTWCLPLTWTRRVDGPVPTSAVMSPRQSSTERATLADSTTQPTSRTYPPVIDVQRLARPFHSDGTNDYAGYRRYTITLTRGRNDHFSTMNSTNTENAGRRYLFLHFYVFATRHCRWR